MEEDLKRVLMQVLEQIQVKLDKEKTKVKLNKQAIVNKVVSKMQAERPKFSTPPIQ